MKLAQWSDHIRNRVHRLPRCALILGSGLGSLTKSLSQAVTIPFQDLPGFPQPAVEGHRGCFAAGELAGVPVIMQQGRLHLYEGHEPSVVSIPVRVMAELGAETLIVTNSAGGTRPEFSPGDLMIITDMINFQSRSVLSGREPYLEETRFVDLSDAFAQDLIDRAEAAALDCGLNGVHKGVYWGNLGPVYETPAEIQMIRSLGGDAVGMSTVPEVIAARHCGMSVLGISCISNLASGLAELPLNHQEVLDTAGRIEQDFSKWVKAIVSKL